MSHAVRQIIIKIKVIQDPFTDYCTKALRHYLECVHLLVKRGCDLLAIKDIMRHADVQTTMRYLHTSEASKREKYERYLGTGCC
jgi:integrase